MENKEWEIAKNKALYEENIKAYNEYLNFVAYLVKVLAYPENALSATVVTNKLIRNGIFSNNGEFKYVNAINNNIEGFLGLNVVNGQGNSRNISAFINDVLTKLGFDSFAISAMVTNDTSEDDEDKYYNQTLSVVRYNGNYYGYDVINNIFYQFDGNNKMKEIHSGNPLYAHYNLDSKTDDYDDYKDKRIISDEELKSILNHVNRQLSQKDLILFDEVVRYSKPYIDKITYGISLARTSKRKIS